MRKAELDDLRLLLSREYASEDEYLKTLWEAVHGLVSARDAHMVWVDRDSFSFAYGPFYDLTQAKKIARLWAPLDGCHVEIRPLLAPAGSTPAEPDWDGYSRTCPACQHPKFAHDWEARAYPAYGHGKTYGCLVRGCGCLERFGGKMN